MFQSTLPASLECHRRVPVKQVAAALGYSYRHTWRLIKTGKLPRPDSIGGERNQSYTLQKFIEITSGSKEVA